MRELSEIRREIDGIDAELVALFVRRMRAVEDVAEAKRASGIAVLDAAREQAVLDRAAAIAGADYAAEARELMTWVMSISRRRQRARLGDASGGSGRSCADSGL